MKNIRRNNEGFTLVEMIVAMAILAILVVFVMGFVSSGTHAFHSVYASVSLQTSAQMITNQLREYMIDCNGGICYATDALYVININDDGTITENLFTFNAADQTVNYARYSLASDGSTKIQEDSGLMASHVTSMTVSTDSIPVGSSATSWETSAATVGVTLMRLGKTYTETETIALRNDPLTAADEATLISAVCSAAANTP